MQLALNLASPRARNTDPARQARDKGMKRVAGNNAEWLLDMRHVARDICRQKGWVCSDDLREWSDAHGRYPTHYNAFGTILTAKEFIPGEYIVSKQAQGHMNRIRRWTLRV